MNSYIRYSFLIIAFLIKTHGHLSAQNIPLSLREAVSISLANNPELKASQLDISKAEQYTVISRSLFLPSINASVSANHYFDRPVFFGLGENNQAGKINYGRFGGEDQGAAAFTLVQPLFNPLATPTLGRSKLQEQESRVLLKDKQLIIVSQVKQTYLRLLVLNKRLELQQQSLQRNQKALQDARLLLVQGKALRVDTLRAFTAVKNLEPDLAKLTYGMETAMLQLQRLMGYDTLQTLLLVDSLTVPTSENLPSESEVYEIARTKNPEFQQLILQEQLAKYEAKQSSAEKLPTVALVGQYQIQTQANNFEYGSALYPATSFIGVKVSIPVFNGFSTNTKTKISKLNQDQSALRLKDANERLKADVHGVVADCNEAQARIQTTKTVTETAKLSFDIIQYRYSKGVASRLELTDAELTLTQAQSNYLEAVYDYLTSRITLHSLMGIVE